MKTSRLFISAFTLFCIIIIPSLVSAQFANFSGSWRSSNKESQQQRLNDDSNNDYVTNYTYELVNGISEKGTMLTIGYTQTDESGNITRHTYQMNAIGGNINGRDEMNTVSFTGKITESNNEEILSLRGNYTDGSNEAFGMDFIYQDNTETGKRLVMKNQLSVNAYNVTDQISDKSTSNAMQIEQGSDGSYWQVVNFKQE